MREERNWEDYVPEGGPRGVIPPLFRNHDGAMFRRCLECEVDLVASGDPYVIEKAFRVYPGFGTTDTVFEYAICLPCMERLYETYSKESRAAIEEYFYANETFLARSVGRLIAVEEGLGEDLGDWIGTCALSGRPVADLEEYQIAALCTGEELVLSHLPWLISGEAIDGLLGLLSNETIDQLDDFSRRHFGLPPEFDARPRRVMPML